MVVLVLVGLATRHGLAVGDATRTLAVLLLTQTLPGAIVWRLVRTWRATLLEDLVAGTAVGAAMAVGLQVVAALTGLAWLAWGGLAVLGVFAVPGIRRRVRDAESTSPPWWWGTGLAVALLPVVPVMESFNRMMPVGWGDGFREIYVDTHFHLAIVGQLLHRGPTSIPFVQGESLNYHWYSHAWVAQLANTASVEPESVLLRTAPALLAGLVALAVGVVASRLSGRWWAGPVASLVALGTGDINVLRPLTSFGGGRYQTPGALSLGFSGLLLVTLLLLVAMRWRTRPTRAGSFLVVVLALAAAGAKGSSLPLLVAGAGLALAVSVWRRDNWRPVALDFGLLLGSLLATFVLVLGGGGGRGSLDPLTALGETGASRWVLGPVEDPSAPLVIFAVGLLLMSTLARAAPLLLAAVVGDEPRDPVLMLLVGSSLAGVGAIIMLTVPGTSQLYFLRNAVPLMGVGTGVGLALLFDGLQTGRFRTALAGVAAGLAAVWLLTSVGTVRSIEPALGFPALLRVSLVFVLLFAVGFAVALRPGRVNQPVTRRPGRFTQAAVVVTIGLLTLAAVPSLEGRMSGFSRGLSPERDPEQRFGISSDQIDAARWLRDHSDRDDVVATNRHCVSPVNVQCDSRRFAVAAYTERQVLVEGWAYTRSWTLSPPRVDKPDVYRFFTNPTLLEANDAFFLAPDDAAAAALGDLGVEWLYIDKTEDYDPGVTEYATVRHETQWALVLELDALAGLSG